MSRWRTASASRPPGNCGGGARCRSIRARPPPPRPVRWGSRAPRPGSAATAGPGARLGMEAGAWTEVQMAEVAARSRAAAVTNPLAQVSGEVSAEKLLGEPYVADPLRAHDCAPVGDGAAAVILASAGRARELCPRP